MSKFYTLVFLLLGLSVFSTGCFIQGGHVDRQVAPVPAIYDAAQKVGTASHALLSEDTFNELIVEIQPVGDFAPEPASLVQLQKFLEAHLNKSGGITFQVNDPLPATGKSHFSIAEIRNLETQSRKTFAKEKRLSVFILFVDGNCDHDEDRQKMLGHAHLSSSIVIYEKTLRDVTADPAQPPRGILETAILEHEFGHLLGLVDNGSPEQSQHRDLDHRFHCANPECLMHYALGSGQSGVLLTSVPTLDQDCEDDLKGNGGKAVTVPKPLLPRLDP